MNKKQCIKVAEENLKLCIKRKTPLKYWIAPVSQEEKQKILKRILKGVEYE